MLSTHFFAHFRVDVLALVLYAYQTMKTLTLTKLAEHLGIPKRTLYDMIADGRFPVQPILGSHPRRWAVEHVEAWRLAQ